MLSLICSGRKKCIKYFFEIYFFLGQKTRMLILIFTAQHRLGEKVKRRTRIGKEETKLSLFEDDMIIY